MNKTRHLDNAINTLGGGNNPLVKRGRSAFLVQVHHDAKRNEYLIQIGTRVVAEGQGDREAATRAGNEHVERLRKLGRNASAIIY